MKKKRSGRIDLSADVAGTGSEVASGGGVAFESSGPGDSFISGVRRPTVETSHVIETAPDPKTGQLVRKECI